MIISNRPKFKENGTRTVKFTNKTIDINFGLDMLNMLCSYCVSTNANIKSSNLINLRNLMEILNMNIYEKDIEKKKRIEFIKKGLDARLIHKLNNPSLIISYICGGIIDQSELDINNFAELDNNSVNYITDSVASALKYSTIYNDVDRGLDLFTRFKAADFVSRSAIALEIEAFVTELQTKFRQINSNCNMDQMFSLREGNFEEVFRDIYDTLTNPNRRLLTQMQGINSLFGNGFEGSRFYLFAGVSGVGKSMLLLNLAYQMKLANTQYQCKDPTKRPCIVYLTQENDVKETISRLFSIISGRRIDEFTFEEAMKQMQENGELFLSDENPIDIIVKFMPNRSIDTNYLYTLTEDLEDDGYEVICLLQDHIKRIRSIERIVDQRLELGAVVNEMKTFAQFKDIPVISISHLNRTATDTLEQAQLNNKSDLLRLVGKSSIGESLLMVDNADYCAFIHKEVDQNGVEYFTFKLTKVRDDCKFTYVCIPVYADNPIRLVTDLYKEPVFKNTLKVPNQVMDSRIPTNIAPSPYGNISDLDGSKNMFSSATVYSSNSIINSCMSIDEMIPNKPREFKEEKYLKDAITLTDNTKETKKLIIRDIYDN